REGGLSKAAEALYISQPSLTKHIRHLEEELGVSLFHRDVKPMQLNAAGDVYYQYLLRQIAAQEDLSNKLSEASGGFRGTLRLGIPNVFGEALLPLVIPKYHRLYPNVRLELHERHGINLHHLVEAGEIDIAFVHMPVTDVTTDYLSYSTEHIFMAVHPDHPEGATVNDISRPDYDFRKMDFTILPQLSYFMPREGQMLHRYAMHFLNHYNVSPPVIMNCGNTSTNLNLTYAVPNSATFVPEYTIRTLPVYMRNRFIFYYLDESELKWDFLVLYPKGKTLSVFAQEMIRLVKEISWELPLN
ncbi:MAG: LysR family transcriptional regulator, partial [Lachnospiraceae bacterium]|nr:LysR family transcriptional regulator [Lachnospiraceae bacterium]